MHYPHGIVRKKDIVINLHYNAKGVQRELDSLLCFMKKLLALGHAFHSKELFLNFPVNKLKMTVEQCKEEYSDGNKRDLASSIFIRSVEMVIDDIIDNNIQFKLPGMGRTLSYIQMKRTSGNDFKKAFKRGKWRDIDFIKSNFSGYLLCFRMLSKKRTDREKLIYISRDKKQKLTEYTNKGKQY